MRARSATCRDFATAITAAALCAATTSPALADEPDPGRVSADARLSFAPQPPGPTGNQSPPAAAETQPLTISTNRPSFTDGTGFVQFGHIQLETGYTFTLRDRSGTETQTHNAPEIQVRIPILEDRLELQLGTSGYVWSRSDSGSGWSDTDGFSDAIAGLRLKVIDQNGCVPRVAVQASTTLGLGDDGVSNQDLEPTFKLIGSWDLGKGWSLAANLGVAFPTTAGDRFTQGQAGACLSYVIDEKWSVYGEYYVFGPNSKGSDAAHYLDGGVAYLLTPRVQLDGRVGFGLNDEANNLFAGFGVSFLF